jgi:DNA-binding response OmpR family regulator/HPt (histidine-containing phosphotransfer) domain-containing protein
MKKILIVEDDQLVANIYRNKFCIEGYRVEVALDGEAGLALAHSFHPNLVLLDLMLPKMTGVEVLTKLRAEPGFEKVPVIIFSNTYMTTMVQEAWKAGATKCLAKANCTPKQVLDVVRDSLSPGGIHKAAPRPSAEPREASPGPSAGAHPPAPPPPPPPSWNAADAEFQAELRKSFIAGLPAVLAAIRKLLQTVIKTDDEAARLNHISELYHRIHCLTGSAGLAGVPQIARMCDALEALLKQLHDKPKTINASTLHTLASAVDFLGTLFDRGCGPIQPASLPPSILVVDDEAISRRAVTYALEKARLKSTCAEDPAAAMDLLAASHFDLVILDVVMPGMSGFELCTRLRTLSQHKNTPVVFITSLNDIDCRSNCTMSGGNDFIAKPFLFIELAVKALVHVLRGRLPAPA